MIRAFYQYLRDRVDLPEQFQFQFNRPKTDFYREQQRLCIKPLDQFMSSIIVEFEANRLLPFRAAACPQPTLRFKQAALWRMFQRFLEISGEAFDGRQNSFTRSLTRYKAIQVVHEAAANSYSIDMPLLRAEMIAARAFDEDAMWIID